VGAPSHSSRKEKRRRSRKKKKGKKKGVRHRRKRASIRKRKKSWKKKKEDAVGRPIALFPACGKKKEPKEKSGRSLTLAVGEKGWKKKGGGERGPPAPVCLDSAQPTASTLSAGVRRCMPRKRDTEKRKKRRGGVPLQRRVLNTRPRKKTKKKGKKGGGGASR